MYISSILNTTIIIKEHKYEKIKDIIQSKSGIFRIHMEKSEAIYFFTADGNTADRTVYIT